MRFISLAFVALMVATPAMAQDSDRSVEDGGVKVDGWKARIDRRPIRQGMSITDSRFAREGNAFRLSIGPAGDFWNDSNVARGDYEVKATFQEHAMATSHPHPSVPCCLSLLACRAAASYPFPSAFPRAAEAPPDARGPIPSPPHHRSHS